MAVEAPVCALWPETKQVNRTSVAATDPENQVWHVKTWEFPDTLLPAKNVSYKSTFLSKRLHGDRIWATLAASVGFTQPIG